MKKNIVWLLFCILFLSACSSWESNEEIVSGLTLYSGESFQMNIPSNWNIITKESNILPNPRNSQIELAVSSPELKYGFSNNLLILSQALNKNISSVDFSILNNVGSSREYVEYLKLESKNIDFVDGEKSNIYIFEAKYNPQTPKFKYLQVGRVCKNKWFLITMALSTDVKNTSLHEEVINTFECK